MVTNRRYSLFVFSVFGVIFCHFYAYKYIRTNDVFIEAPYKHTVGVGITFNLTAITFTSTTKSIHRDFSVH